MIPPTNVETVNRRRWYRFTYHTPGRGDRELLPHQLRDGDAALFLQSALHERGFEYAGLIFNYPPEEPPVGDVPVDESFLRAGDLLVLTTRPPLDDMDDGVKSRVRRSHSALEAKIFACIRRHLPHCSRASVIVSDIHARAFPPVAQLRNIQFRQKRGAAIEAFMAYGTSKWQHPASGDDRTIAYLIFEDSAWENGPGVLASFGMSGTDTLVWNYHLATRFRALVASAPFIMAEIIPRQIPLRPHTVEFAREWQVRLLTTDAQSR